MTIPINNKQKEQNNITNKSKKRKSHNNEKHISSMDEECYIFHNGEKIKVNSCEISILNKPGYINIFI